MAAEAAAKVVAEAEAAAAAAKAEAARVAAESEAARVEAEAVAAAAQAEAEAAAAAARAEAAARTEAAGQAKASATANDSAADPGAEDNQGLMRHVWALMACMRKAHAQMNAKLDAILSAHQAFVEEQRRASIELKAVVRAGPAEDRGSSSQADLPRRPLQTRLELEKLCSDLQRMPTFRKSMVSLH